MAIKGAIPMILRTGPGHRLQRPRRGRAVLARQQALLHGGSAMRLRSRLAVLVV
jgi:hypothetical protein